MIRLKVMIYMICTLLTTSYLVLAQPFTPPILNYEWLIIAFLYVFPPYLVCILARFIFIVPDPPEDSAFIKWAHEKQKEELESFTELMREQQDEDLGMLVAMACDFRHKFLDATTIDLNRPEFAMDEHPELLFELCASVNEAQREGDFNTAGSMLVWVHTLRAASIPALTPAGQALWAELARGYPHVEQAAKGYLSITGVTLNTQGADHAPEKMTPDAPQNASPL